jgi:hypothetical protein
LGGAAEGDVEGDAEIAVGPEHGAEGVFVVAAGDGEFRDGFKHVGAPVTVGIGEAGELLALGDVEAALRCRDNSERFVEAFGEKGVARLGVGVVGAVDPPDFAAAGGNEQASRRHSDDTADLEHDGVGHGERGALPITTFGSSEHVGRLDEAFGGGGVVGLREREERNGEAGENRERERE